jgi:hypothetical protein
MRKGITRMSGSSAKPMMHEGEPPESRDHAREARAERPPPVVEVHPAQHPLEAPGDREDPEDVARVVVDQAVETRLAGDEDVHVGLGDRQLDVLGRLAALHAEGDGRPRRVLLDLLCQLDPVAQATVDRHDQSPVFSPAFAAAVAIDRLHHGGRRLLALEGVPALDERADPALLEGRDHAVVDLVEGPPVVEARFDEVRADERGPVIERDEQAVDALRVVDDALDVGGVLRRLRHLDHHGLGLQEAARLRLQVARRPVPDRVDLVVVDAVDAVHLLRDLVDADEGGDVEDVAVARLDHQLDVVRAAERTGVLVVDLHEGVGLRQQVAEARLELQLEAQVRKVPGDDEHDDHHRVAVVDEPLPEPVERALVLLARRSAAHGGSPSQPCDGSQLLPPSVVR